MKYRYRNEDEMKDSGVEWIGKIPEEWYTIKGKYLFNSNKQKNSGRLENILSLTLNGVIDRDKNNLEGLQPENFDGYQEFYSENLVFKLIDLQNINTSRVGYVHKDGLMSPAYIKLAKKKGDINTKYYFYNYFDYYNQNIYNFLGSVGVRSALNSDDLLEMVVINTSISEQNKISKFLDEKTAEFDSIISKKEDLIKKLQEAKKSLISEVITGKVKVVKSSHGYELVERKKEEMKDSGVEWLGHVPKEWNLIKLKFISDIYRGAILRPVDEPTYFDENGHWKYLNISDATKCDMYLNEGGIGLSQIGSEKSARVEAGNLILTASATIGKPLINNIDVCIHDGFIAFKNFKVIREFLYYVLKNQRIYENIGKSNTQKNIYLDEVKNIYIAQPSLEEQKLFIEYLNKMNDSLDATIKKTNEQIEKLKEAKQSLISEAVTGKIEILE